MDENLRNRDIAWQAIFDHYHIHRHNFDETPFELSATQIKQATRHFNITGQREVRILCKQDEREDRPTVFQERGLFILPIRNGKYVIVKGEGYVDIPFIESFTDIYVSQLPFKLITSFVGDSEMQHLDYAYATSLIRTFMEDSSLVLTIRGRKYSPRFNFNVGQHNITVQSVQTEVDAGYEGENQVVLIEAKKQSPDTIIRQLYYPLRQWQYHVDKSETNKKVSTVFFEKWGNEFSFWQFHFRDVLDYNSIELIKSRRFRITR